MAHQILARKQRPQTFKDVIGQDETITALRNALKQNRVAHAYIFSGIRGVGKTTVARIFSKAINCKKRTSLKDRPCNECQSCLQVTNSSDFDVIEIDAATFSKVEQIRELTEGLNYAPTHSLNKIVIIDEIHRLSRQAFDALLKIIEEPPPHLVFIFATTNLETLPATILSRCQKYHFHRVPSPNIKNLLKDISHKEKIEINDASLDLISNASDGSVRDSLSLLEQLATYGNGTITNQDILDILGTVDNKFLKNLLDYIISGAQENILTITDDIEKTGTDPYSFYCQFVNYLKNLMLYLIDHKRRDSTLGDDSFDHLPNLLNENDRDLLILLLQFLIEKENFIKQGAFPMISLRIVLVLSSEILYIKKMRSFLLEDPTLSNAMPSDRKTYATESIKTSKVRSNIGSHIKKTFNSKILSVEKT